MQMKTLFLVAIAFLLLSVMQCEDNPVAPAQPGRRDYVWTADTLQIPYGDVFYPFRMWGSAANDVWLVGSGSPSMFWHFDGTKWSHMTAYDGVTDPTALFGFASNDIWLAGRNEFWKYDGAKWNRFRTVSPPAGFDITSIQDLWGSSPSDVWGVGFADQLSGGTDYEGIIMHFDGGQWQFMPIPDLRVSFVYIRQHSSNLLFLEGWYATNLDTFRVYSFNRKDSLREIYSSTDVMTISQIGDEIYFVSQQAVYEYVNGKLTLWRDFADASFGAAAGRSESDILGYITNDDFSLWRIAHFNGSDIEVLYTIPNGFRPNGISVLFNGDFFLSCSSISSNQCIVVHGQLP